MRALALVLLLLPAAARASQADMFGPSLPRVGMAGAGDALADHAGSTVRAPAALGLADEDLVRMHYLGGLLALDPVHGVTRLDGKDEGMPFEPIQPSGVTVDLLKTITPFFRVGAWVNVSLPYLYFHDSKDPWVPYAGRWQSRYARSMGGVGASFRIPIRGIPAKGAPKEAWDDALRGGLWLGASFTLRPRGVIDIDLDLVGRTEDDTTRIDTVLRDVDLIAEPVIRPVFSLLFDLGAVHERLDGLRIGAAYQAESTTEINPIGLDVEVRGLGELNALFSLVDRIQAQVWLGLFDFFDPHQVTLSLAYEHPRFAAALDVQWNGWSALAPSYGRVVRGRDGEEGRLDLVLDTPSGENVLSYPVAGGRTVDSSAFHDTWDVSVGGEVRLPPKALPTGDRPMTAAVRLGYRYQPAFMDPVDGPTALLESDTHSWGLGATLQLPGPGAFSPLILEGAVQVLRMDGMDLPKTAAGMRDVVEPPVAYASDAAWPGGWGVVGGGSLALGF
jgi:hypothetical protein